VDPKLSWKSIAKIRGQEFLLWSVVMPNIKLRVLLKSQEEHFKLDWEDRENDVREFEEDLRFTLERDSEATFGIDRTGFF
jgi:hypothetical protein